MLETSKRTPPYIGVKKLNETIDIMSRKNYSEVSPILFMSNGFSKIDALLAISLLKCLGILDEQGNPNNELMSKLRLAGDARKKAFDEIIRASYSGLFETIDEPQNLSSEALDNAFLAHYPDLSRRVLKGVKPVFFRLCELAGLKEKGSVRTRNVKPRSESKIKEVLKPNKTLGLKKDAPRGFHEHSIVRGKMFVIIPEDIFMRTGREEELNKDWFTVLKSAHDFADKYLKSEDTNEDEQT